MPKKSCPICKKTGAYHHGDLKHAILQAALEILSRKGIHTLSLRAVAKQAGVSPAAPYRHFPNKEALLASLAAHGFRILQAEMKSAAEKHPEDFITQLADAAVAFIQFSQTHQELYRLMDLSNPADYSELNEAHTQTEMTFVEMIKKGQEKKAIVDGDPVALATAAFAFGDGLCRMLMQKNCHLHAVPCAAEVETWVRDLCRIVWNGLGRKKMPATRNSVASKHRAHKTAALPSHSNPR